MNTRLIAFAVVSLAITGPAAFAEKKGGVESGSSVLRALSDSFADVAEQVKPSVVTVYSEKTVRMPRSHWGMPFEWFFDGEDGDQPRRPQPRQFKYKQNGMGSGILIDKEGHILTNNHVVDDQDKVNVKFANGETYDTEVLGTDPRTDLALLKIKGKLPAGLVPATLGDSDALRVGEWVLAVGAPFGFEQTVTTGIISAKGRSRVGIDRDLYENFLQTDAAINPGNSGGPLVNTRGEVIGINSAIISQVGQFAGVGFAIPANMAKRVMRDLLKTGRVSRGFLGVGIQDLNADLVEEFRTPNTKGALVSQVNPNSPAAKAGIQVGDVIVRYAGKAVEDTQGLRLSVADTDPGAKVELVVIRDGKERTLTATVGELPDGDGDARRSKREEAGETTGDYGLTVEPLTDRQAKLLGYEEESGVLVSAVDNDSPAERAGIRPGDLIVKANHDRVANLDEFRAALKKSKGKVALLIKNKGGSRFVILQAK